MASVRMILHNDARVRADAPIELCDSDIHGIHARGAALQQTIGEAACRCANVDTHLARHIDTKVRQCRIQLESSTTDERQVSEYLDLSGCGDGMSRLFLLLMVHQNATGENQRLCSLTRLGETAIDQ